MTSGAPAPSHTVVCWKAFELLEQLAGGPETGELDLVDARGGVHGRVLVAGHRLGLVRGVPGQPRLDTVLQREQPEVARQFRTATLRARQEGAADGGAPAVLSRVDVASLRMMLLHQFSSALLALARHSLRAPLARVWSGTRLLRQEESRLSGFAFEDVALALGRALDAAEPDAAERLVSECGGAAQVCLLFLHESDGALQPFPLSVRGMDASGLAEIRALTVAVQQVLRPPALLAADVQPEVMMISDDVSDWVAVRGRRRLAVLGGLTKQRRVEALSRGMQLCREEHERLHA